VIRFLSPGGLRLRCRRRRRREARVPSPRARSVRMRFSRLFILPFLALRFCLCVRAHRAARNNHHHHHNNNDALRAHEQAQRKS